MKPEEIVALTTEVKELLSQIQLKLKDINGAEAESDDDGYWGIANRDELEDRYLSSVKSIVSILNSSGASYVEEMLVNYYDSNCY